MIKLNRLHSINILENIYKYLLLLIFPIIRGLVTIQHGFSQWLSGAWFDIVIVSIIIAVGYIKWISFQYFVYNNALLIKKGIIFKKEEIVFFDDISSAIITYPFFYLPIRAVHLIIDTDCGKSKKFDVYLTLNQIDAMIIMNKVNKDIIDSDNLKKIYSPKILYIAILSLVTSNSTTGVLFLATLISQSGKILGQEIQNQIIDSLTNIAKFLAFGLPPTGAIITYIILIGWVVSFILNLLKNKGFTVSRINENITIKNGLVIKNFYRFTLKKINLIEVHQSLTTKFFGFLSIMIRISGYGKNKNELAIFIPSADKLEAMRNLNILIPEINIVKKQIKPKFKTFMRFMIPPLNLILAVFVIFIIILIVNPEFNQSITFIGIMAQIPCIWWLIVKITSFFHTGIGYKDNNYTLYSTYGYRILTRAVSKNKIVKLEFRQSMFQKMSDCCDVVVYVYSEKKYRIVIPNLNTEQAVEMFEFSKADFDL